ncbi:hypothetical protein [Catenulispora pinisilvae]|uniref:hypothetical protein n=1 Tax=Catenulispora pinisilvae TaxID=2705253 RepID=UPI0018918C09|nr:hypothetical protein [Catenulispora pinisilvae]
MSESQFTYSGMTLDELRSLAASPQVGTIQAMPQSFRSLAERVGDVADLLAHAQTDLPNWWRGPAAEQAAATLGRAAAEAREFHDSAMGAATAVGRCAQIVAEQQHQMMNVPELPEPGITDVVRRPTTPFEALEAARQDAAYQAAHEQAVQVVNGIAAQYVETRSQLSNIGIMFGENFTPAGDPITPSSNTGTLHDSTWHTAAPETTTTPKSSESRHFHNESRTYTAVTTPSNSHNPTTRGKSHYSPPRPEGAFAPEITHREVTTQGADRKLPNNLESNDLLDPYETPWASVDSERYAPIGTAEAPSTVDESVLTSTSVGYPRANNTQRTIRENEAQDELTRSSLSRRLATAVSVRPVDQVPHAAFNERPPAGTATTDRSFGSTGDISAVPPPQLAHQSQVNGTSDENTSMIPPFSGPGSIYRTHEDRSPRPAYLKERKSVWIPDTVAAPADGVIGPDWLADR